MFEIMAKTNVTVTIVILIVVFFMIDQGIETPSRSDAIKLIPLLAVWLITAGFVLLSVVA